MNEQSTIAEVNIHLRARARDRAIIDQAAELVGANRSKFMIASALKEAKNVLLDQTTIHADAKAFQKIMDWMDSGGGRARVHPIDDLLEGFRVGVDGRLIEQNVLGFFESRGDHKLRAVGADEFRRPVDDRPIPRPRAQVDIHFGDCRLLVHRPTMP